MKKILIVDDEELLRNLWTEIVKVGFPEMEVICAPDGVKAIELFRENQSEIVLIITDNDMPKMKGVALVQLIKKTDPKMPIIMATAGYKIPENHGANILISKPLPPAEEVIETIRSLLPTKPPAPL